MRSLAEIRFRLRQEAANLYLLLRPPVPHLEAPAPLAELPNGAAVAGALRDGPFAAEVIGLADEISAHRFPLLGRVIDTGPEIDWRRDYVHGLATGTAYFRCIPYLDFTRAGDHKFVWELNRHQHLMVLAQAWLFTRQPQYLNELVAQLESWMRANPFQRGINWTSALEVAFRAISWIWIWHWAGEALPAGFRRRMLLELYHHGLHLQYNLSLYFSPNTHLLGEAVALHALGRMFPHWPRAEAWRRMGRDIVREQMDAQVREDGSHFEQSTYYHVYAVDLFVFHHILEPAPDRYQSRLRRMAEALAAWMGAQRRLPLLGDDDGGRLFHPYGRRDTFGRATLATAACLWDDVRCGFEPADVHQQAAWWLGERALSMGSRPAPAPPSQRFADSGLTLLTSGDVHVVIDTGPMGDGGAGHSHADGLSLVVRRGDEEILIDPGTYTYIADPSWRDWFRGTAAHNTLRIGDRDQALPAGPFRWSQKPSLTMRQWSSGADFDFLDAECAYGVTHRRRVLFLKGSELLFVLDEAEGEGEHRVEQFWHLGPAAQPARLVLPAQAVITRCGSHGWASPVFGKLEPAPVAVVEQRGSLPRTLAAVIDVAPTPRSGSLAVERQHEEWVLHWSCGRRLSVRFPAAGLPQVVSGLPC